MTAALAGTPDETPQQHVRNAMTLIQATLDMTASFEVGVRFDRSDLAAILLRLSTAVKLLEHTDTLR